MVDTYGNWRGSGRLFLFALVLTPITIVLHELGHFSVAALSGRPAELHLSSVSGGALPSDPMWLQAAQAGAGPFVTFLLTFIGLVAFRRGGHLWAMALTAGAISRVITDLGYLCIRLFLFAIGKPFAGNPNFDELVFARHVGLNEVVASSIASTILGVTVWLLWRWAEPGRRAAQLAATILGVMVAYVPMLMFGDITLLTI
jgi:hypothetical protein